MGAVIVFLLTLAITIPLGVPIAFVLILCAITLMQFLGQTDMTIITQNMIMGANNAALMAIPFFMLAGEVMSRGGLSRESSTLQRLWSAGSAAAWAMRPSWPP